MITYDPHPSDITQPLGQHRRWATTFAHGLSLIAHPILGSLLLFILLAGLHPAWAGAIVRVGMPIIVGSLGLLIVGMWQHWWSDWNMSDLADRRRYLPGVWGWVLLSTWMAHGPSVPLSLATLIVGIALWLTLVIAISMSWKVSLHVSGMAVVTVFAIGYWGWWGFLATAWLPFLIGWARLYLRRHTLAQVLVGALVGAGSMMVAWHIPW